MRLVSPKVLAVLAVALPLLAGCNGTGSEAAGAPSPPPAADVETPADARPAATQPAIDRSAPQLNGLGLASFDVVRVSDGEVVGSLARTGPGTWEGPHPATGEPAVFSSEASPTQVVLVTDGPPIMTLIVYLDTNTVSASAYDEPHRLARAIYE